MSALPDFSANDSERLLSTARQRICDEADAVRRVADALDDSFVTAIRCIRSAPGRVITVGAGTSSSVAQRMAHLLSTSGTPAMFLHPGEALHGSLGAVTRADVVLAISKGGSSAEMNTFAERAKVRGAALVVLTAAPRSPLAGLADVVVQLPDSPESDPGGVIAMGSSLVSAVWGDALAIVLMQISGYEWSAVLGSHPSGAVGQQIKLPRALPRLPDPALSRGGT